MNAETMAFLIAKGLTADDLLEAARLMEIGKPRSSGAARQARYRKKQRESVTSDVTSDVTGDVTKPPIENIIPPSVSNETGGEPPDPIAEMFNLGVGILKSQGYDERRARSLIGSWRKGRSPGDVVAALVDAKTRSISNLVEWMPKRLSAVRSGSDPPNYLDHLLERRRQTGET